LLDISSEILPSYDSRRSSAVGETDEIFGASEIRVLGRSHSTEI